MLHFFLCLPLLSSFTIQWGLVNILLPIFTYHSIVVYSFLYILVVFVKVRFEQILCFSALVLFNTSLMISLLLLSQEVHHIKPIKLPVGIIILPVPPGVKALILVV